MSLTTLREYPIDYFLWHGAKYGCVSGTLIGACFGMIYGAAFGGVIGSVMGLFIGFLINLILMIYEFFPQMNRDAVSFRKRLVIHGTLMVLVVHILVSCVPGWFGLYNSWAYGTTDARDRIELLGVIYFLITTPFVLFSGAYTFSYYADRWMARLAKVKNDESTAILAVSQNHDRFFFQQFWRRVKYFAPLIAIGVGIFHGSNIYHEGRTTFLEATGHGLAMVPLALVYISLATLVLALLNSWLILCLNRIYFQEYVPYLTLEQYKRRLMWCAGIATFFASPILTFGIFMPLAVGIAVLTARSYANMYYQAGEKWKNDEKMKRAEAT